mgnify:CR=1 FL=1
MDGSFEVRKESGRVYVETDGDYDYDETVATLSRIFGIVGICPVELHEDEGFDKLCEAVIEHINMYTRIRAYLQGKCETCQKELSDDLHGDKCRSR